MNLGKLVVAMALTGATVALGCGGGSVATKCTGDAECGRGSICVDNKCTVRECDNSASCLANQVCVLIPGGDLAVKFCTARECNNTDDPCDEANTECQNGLCVPSTTTDVIETADDTTEPDTNTPAVDNSCKSCSVSDECGANHLCSAVGSAETKFCLKTCVADQDCKSGYVCFQVTSEAKQCVPVSYKCVDCAGAGCPVGKTCDLVSGGCIDVVDECDKCTQDFQCGVGARCYKKTGASAGVCVPECGATGCADAAKFTCGTNDRGVSICIPRNEAECSPCPAAKPNTLSDGTCVECANSSQCTSPKVCNTTTYKCEDVNTCTAPTPKKCADGNCHQCCEATDCTGLVAPGTEKCTDYVCEGSDLCGGCTEPTPLCVKVGDNYMCGTCAKDADCIDMVGCTCSEQIPFCVDATGNVCQPAGATCTTECSDTVACPAYDSMGYELACHEEGYCFNMEGGCNGVESCCSEGNDCFDLMSVLAGGGDIGAIMGQAGMSGALFGVCTCKVPTATFDLLSGFQKIPSQECPLEEPCFSTDILGFLITLPSNVAGKNVCFDLTALFGSGGGMF